MHVLSPSRDLNSCNSHLHLLYARLCVYVLYHMVDRGTQRPPPDCDVGVLMAARTCLARSKVQPQGCIYQTCHLVVVHMIVTYHLHISAAVYVFVTRSFAGTTRL